MIEDVDFGPDEDEPIPKWREEFSNYKVEEWGKWRIGRPEAVVFITKLLSELIESIPSYGEHGGYGITNKDKQSLKEKYL